MPFHLKKNDRLPTLRAALKNADGTGLDLTGIPVVFRMRARSNPTLKVDGPAVVVDATGGVVEYEWAEGDTDTAGGFVGEFVLNFAGRLMTVPNSGTIAIEIANPLS